MPCLWWHSSETLIYPIKSNFQPWLLHYTGLLGWRDRGHRGGDNVQVHHAQQQGAHQGGHLQVWNLLTCFLSEGFLHRMKIYPELRDCNLTDNFCSAMMKHGVEGNPDDFTLSQLLPDKGPPIYMHHKDWQKSWCREKLEMQDGMKN